MKAFDKLSWIDYSDAHSFKNVESPEILQAMIDLGSAKFTPPEFEIDQPPTFNELERLKDPTLIAEATQLITTLVTPIQYYAYAVENNKVFYSHQLENNGYSPEEVATINTVNLVMTTIPYVLKYWYLIDENQRYDIAYAITHAYHIFHKDRLFYYHSIFDHNQTRKWMHFASLYGMMNNNFDPDNPLTQEAEEYIEDHIAEALRFEYPTELDDLLDIVSSPEAYQQWESNGVGSRTVFSDPLDPLSRPITTLPMHNDSFTIRMFRNEYMAKLVETAITNGRGTSTILRNFIRNLIASDPHSFIHPDDPRTMTVATVLITLLKYAELRTQNEINDRIFDSINGTEKWPQRFGAIINTYGLIASMIRNTPSTYFALDYRFPEKYPFGSNEYDLCYKLYDLLRIPNPRVQANLFSNIGEANSLFDLLRSSISNVIDAFGNIDMEHQAFILKTTLELLKS